MDGYLPSLGWSPTNPRMFIHKREVYYRHGIWHLDLSHKTNKRGQLSLMIIDKIKDGHPNLPKYGH